MLLFECVEACVCEQCEAVDFCVRVNGGGVVKAFLGRGLRAALRTL